MKKNYPLLLDLIGNTPLARLELDTPATVLAKLEYFNPGGSIKDRAALFMVQDAERTGKLKPGGTIVEASSGNQGIALATIGRAKGYRVIITVPGRTSDEKVATLKALGAEVRLCPNVARHDDPQNYHALAKQLAEQIPGAYMPDQYFNVLNPEAHYRSTGPEIWNQTNGEVTHVIIAAGSCGTISGVGKFLKEKNPNIKVIGVDAANSAYSSKEPKPYMAEGLGIDVISDTLNEEVIDHIIPITDQDAFAGTKKLAQEYGILAGISSGALFHVAVQYAPTFKSTDVVVLIFADSGRAYLNKVFVSSEVECCQQVANKNIDSVQRLRN
ncbi:MAG: cysteine synthase family protein [Epsilonproteobacteria bacterium]|nr:cysteine synthase family protein [Campylobacterota bacterium]